MSNAENNQEELDTAFEFSQPIDEAEAPKPLPKGTYVAEITETKPGRSKDTGNKYVMLTLKIDESKYPHDFKGPQGGFNVRRVVMMTDDDKSRWQLRKLWEACGLSLPKTRIEAQDLLGKTVMVELDTRQFPEGSGIYQNEVKSIKKVA